MSLGLKSWASVVEESTYGTDPGSGYSYFEIIEESLKTEMPVKPRKSMRSVSHRDTFTGQKKVGGVITLEALYEGLFLFLKHAMGGYAFTVDTPVADANTHTFTLADSLPTGLTVEVSKADLPTGKVFLYEGCKVNTFEMSLTPEEILQFAVGLMGQSETADTTASGSPTYPTFLPILFSHSGTLTVAGTASLDFDDFKLNINNNLAERFFMRDTTLEPDRNAKRGITGEVTLEFADLALYTKFIEGTKGTLALNFTSTTMVTGSTPYSMAIAMPNIQLEGATPVINSEGRQAYTVPFVGLHSGSSDDALTITVVSGESTLA